MFRWLLNIRDTHHGKIYLHYLYFKAFVLITSQVFTVLAMLPSTNLSASEPTRAFSLFHTVHF